MRDRRVFFGLILLAVLIVSRGSPAMSGDAAYYLAVSDSITRDFDLDLRNQFAPGSDYPFRESAERSFAREGRGGALLPSQGLGWSALIAPVFLAAEAVAGVLPEGLLTRARWNRERAARDLISLAMALLAGWLALLTLRLSRRALAAEPPVLLMFLAFATPPLIYTAIHPGPELGAALLAVWFVLEMTRDQTRFGPWRAAAALALLPWLHLRFVPIAIAGGIWLARRGHGRALAAPALSLALFAATTLLLFGSVLPPPIPDARPLSVDRWIASWFAALVSADRGLLPIAPFWLFALAGIGRIRARLPHVATFAALSFLGLLLTGDLFDDGRASQPPGMTLAPVLPLAAPFLAAAWLGLSARWPRRLLALAVVWTLVFLALVVERPRRLLAEPGDGLGQAPARAYKTWRDRNTPASQLRRLGLPLDEAGFLRSVRDGHLAAVDLYLDAGFQAKGAIGVALEHRQTATVARLAERGGPMLESARALLRARTSGDDEMVKALASAGVTYDTADRSGETALMHAVRTYNAGDRMQLMALGASIDARTRTGETALMIAVLINDVAAGTDLIAGGADVNATDVDGWTPLLYAARYGHDRLAAALVHAGADPNVRSRLGWTPLLWATHTGHPEIVRALLAAGADPNVWTHAGLSPLIRAAGRGQADIVKALLERGADPSAAIGGETARDWAVRNGHAAIVALLDAPPKGSRR